MAPSNGLCSFMLKMGGACCTYLICRRNELSRVYFLVNMDNASLSAVSPGEVREPALADVCSHPFPEAEELYQKRVPTITGICIALLVAGIMCVVAYCKTK